MYWTWIESTSRYVPNLMGFRSPQSDTISLTVSNPFWVVIVHKSFYKLRPLIISLRSADTISMECRVFKVLKSKFYAFKVPLSIDSTSGKYNLTMIYTQTPNITSQTSLFSLLPAEGWHQQETTTFYLQYATSIFTTSIFNTRHWDLFPNSEQQQKVGKVWPTWNKILF